MSLLSLERYKWARKFMKVNVNKNAMSDRVISKYLKLYREVYLKSFKQSVCSYNTACNNSLN